MLTAAHWLHRGLTDYNPRSATRSDVPGNRGVIIPRSMVKCKRGRFNSFSGKMHRSAQAGTLPPQGGAAVRPPARLGAFPGVARMGGNVPAVLVYSCQATGERRFKGLSPYSQWQRGFLVAPKKFFQFFFETFDPIVVRIRCYIKSATYLRR